MANKNVHGSPRKHALPVQPVFAWDAIGGRAGALPNVLDLPYVQFTRSARSALTLALDIFGIGPGAQVAIPNYYCPTMPAPIDRAGATVVFYPILRNGLPDVRWLREHVHERWRAVLAVHFFGLPADFAEVRQFCSEHGVYLIEDCAHAFFGAAGAVPVGTTGDVAIASLPKFFPVGEGGILASSRRPLSHVVLPPASIKHEVQAAWRMAEAAAAHRRLFGLNTLVNRLSALQRGRSPVVVVEAETSVLSAAEVRETALADPLLVPRRLTAVERWVARHVSYRDIVAKRRRNYSLLARLLTANNNMEPLFPVLPDSAAPYVFPLRVADADRVFALLRQRRMPVLRWDRYWPDAIDGSDDVGRSWAHSVVQLLCHQDLRPDDIERMAANVIDIVGR